jgi:hypothetical protein
VLDATRHHEDLAWLEFDVTVPEVDRKTAADDKEEAVCLVVLVPDEWAFDLDDLSL